MPTTETLKPDFRIYKHETTGYWIRAITRRAGRLYDVYVFDANRRVHCCELTPSYEMNYVGPTWDASGPDYSEDDEDLLSDILVGASGSDDTMYVHCRSVKLEGCESLNYYDAQWDHFLKDADGDHEEAYRAATEKLIEYCQGNGYVY